MDLTQTQAQLDRLTDRVIKLENKPAVAQDQQTSLNKTNIERLDMILTHHQKEITRLAGEISDLKIANLPIKKKKWFW